MPVSSTVNWACVSTHLSRTVIVPDNVNLNAFDNKLKIIFSHISRSTKIASGKGEHSTINCIRACSIVERKTLASSAVSVAKSVSSYVAWIRPASMREKSSNVLTNFSKRSPLRCTNSIRSRCFCGNGETVSASASSVGLNINVKGVRNSWETLLKNTVFARSISARASARWRSAS